MQIKKDNTEEIILKTAEKMFLENGFTQTSMRNIAAASGVGLSNIYNYFKNKDEIFYHLVKPLILEFHRLFDEHHGRKSSIDALDMVTEKYMENNLRQYTELFTNHRTRMRLLFLKSQGSALQNFKEESINKTTEQLMEWFDMVKEKYPHINTNITKFSVHLHTVWMFSFVEELIMHDVQKEEFDTILKEYLVFETTGWKELMKI